MSYMPHINNLYKSQEILLFKECFVLEKIHGTNAKLVFNPQETKELIRFYSGGEKYLNFLTLFDREKLEIIFKSLTLPCDRTTTVFGEAYGGSQQGMSETYGKQLKFVCFDVAVGDNWLNVLSAEKIVQTLGLEFVYYVKISTDLKEIDAQRDADSVQAFRNGMGNGKLREGVVLRPLIEVKMNNGNRIIAKHKRDEFKETTTPRKVVDTNLMTVLEDAEAIANEWVTKERLVNHILPKIKNPSIEKMREIIYAIVEDITREGKGEIVFNNNVTTAIGRHTAALYKNYLKEQFIAQNKI